MSEGYGLDEGKSRDRNSHPTLTLLDKCLLSFGYLEPKILFHLSRNFKITSPLTLISSFLTTLVIFGLMPANLTLQF